MTTDRIKEIQETTAYPFSVSVQQALLQVWNECQQDNADNAIRFAEWLVGDINGNGATKQQLQDNTTTDLYNIFLNKQNNEKI